MFKSGMKELTVVYKDKDEMALFYLKKLVETNDDEYGQIVGSEDDTVYVTAWNEKVYEENKIIGNIPSKIIFLGNVKGVNSVIPILDIKYSKFGVSYGFSGNQAVIKIEEKKLQSDKDFVEFQKEYDNFVKYLNNNSSIEKKKELDVHKGAKISKVLAIALSLTYPIIGIPFVVGATITDSIDRKNLREKMFLYAITKFYIDELDEFMKS